METSAVERTVADIRTFMRDRRLGVGDPLPTEVELASHCGASRNTVREALRTLKAYGIVETRQKAGAIITDRRQDAIMSVFSFALDLSADTFRDIQSFRRMIETTIGGHLIGTIRPETINAAEAVNEKMALATDAASAAPLDFEFHTIIIDAVQNNTLSEIYRMFKPLMTQAMEMGKARDLTAAIGEHRLILQALREKDALAYAFHTTSHARFGLQCLSDADGERTVAEPAASSGEIRI